MRAIILFVLRCSFCLFVGLEILLRLFPQFMPLGAAYKLPNEDRRRVILHHGGWAKGSIIGEGMLYSYNKTFMHKYRPFNIDNDGYRNPSSPSGDVDIVILGDSVAMAEDLDHDFADKFREQGFRTYSLAFGGYGPGQYKDAYKKYIIDKNIAHKYVCIFYCSTNDISNVYDYVDVLMTHGNYEQYLETTFHSSYNDVKWFHHSWFIDLAIFYSDNIFTKDKSKWIMLNLPYYNKTFDVSKVSVVECGMNDVATTNLVYANFLLSVCSIINYANSVGATPVFVFLPNWHLLYNQAMEFDDKLYYCVYKPIKLLNIALADFSARYKFIDLTPLLSSTAMKKLVTTDIYAYHLNSFGVDISAHEIIKLIRSNCEGDDSSVADNNFYPVDAVERHVADVVAKNLDRYINKINSN